MSTEHWKDYKNTDNWCDYDQIYSFYPRDAIYKRDYLPVSAYF